MPTYRTWLYNKCGLSHARQVNTFFCQIDKTDLIVWGVRKLSATLVIENECRLGIA